MIECVDLKRCTHTCSQNLNHSVELSFDDFDEDEAVGFIESFIKQIKKDLTTRFTDCSLLSCFKIFDPSSYVETDTFKRSKLGDYGLADLHKLLKRFCGKDLDCKLFTANPQSIYQEFNSMKLVLWSVVNQDLRASSSFASVWAKIADEEGHKFPHMLNFVYALCVIPVHTCEVERGFSQHRIIKHRLTSRLRIVTLDSLMRIKLSGHKADDFNFVAASENVANIESVGSMPTTQLHNLYLLVNNVSIPNEDLVTHVEEDDYSADKEVASESDCGDDEEDLEEEEGDIDPADLALVMDAVAVPKAYLDY